MIKIRIRRRLDSEKGWEEVCSRLKKLKKAHADGEPRGMIESLASQVTHAWKAACSIKVDRVIPLPPFPYVRQEGYYDWYADQGMEIPAHSPPDPSLLPLQGTIRCDRNCRTPTLWQKLWTSSSTKRKNSKTPHIMPKQRRTCGTGGKH